MKLLHFVLAVMFAAVASAQTSVTINSQTKRLQPTVPYIVFPPTAIRLDDTDASHQLIFTNGSNLTANRTFTLVPGDGNLSISFAGATNGQVLKFDGTNWVPGTTSGIGTVTSVAVTGANGISVSGSPITGSGTIALALGAITPTSVASSGAVSGTTGTFSSLTSGRIPFATTAGLLTDNSALTFNSGSGDATATSFTASSYLHANSAGAGIILVTGANVVGGNAAFSAVATGVQPWSHGVRHASRNWVLNNGYNLAGTDIITIDPTNGALTLDGSISAVSTIGGTQLISSVATGTAPLTVASTTNVANLNASSLSGATFAAPGSIGSGTPGSGAFTSLSATSPAFTTSMTTPSTTFALVNTTATTVNAFGAATTVNTGASATQIWNFGGSTTASEFRFLEPSGSGTNYSAFKAVAQSANITYSLPPTVGGAGTFLTDVAGDGVLTWGTPSGSGNVTNSGTLTNFAIATGAGTTVVKTPSATSTLDASGNMALAGTLSATVFSGAATLSTLSTSGIFTLGGAVVTPANALGAFVIDVTEPNNTKTISADQTFTFSGTPAAAWQQFKLFVENSDASAHTLTIPSSFSVGRGSAITTVIIGALGKLTLVWVYDGSAYNLYGDPPATSGTGSYVLTNGATLDSPLFTTNITLANGSAPTTSAVAQIAFDTNAWAASRGAAQIYDGTANTFVVATLASDTPSDGQFPRWNTGGTITWESPAGAGTVTSVGWTGGIVSVANPTSTPAFTIAGTSGGIPYFSSGTAWASSAALAANALVIGGGAGAAPATTTTGTGVVTALGVNTGSSGAFVVNGGALGTPSSGTLTNATGLPASGIAAGTLGATITLGETVTTGGIIMYDAALSADGRASGKARAGTAGATLAFGDLVYLAAADSRWELADADSATTSGNVLIGICILAAASDGDPTTILLEGFVRADTAFPTMTISAPQYISATAGDITGTAPSTTGQIVRRVGFAWTADELYFNPSMDSGVAP